MNIKKTIAIVVTGGVLLSGVAAYAATTTNAANPANQKQISSTAPRYGRMQNVDFLAKLTGKSTDEILKLMQSGKTMAQIAEENGVTLDEFKKAMLNQRESYIDQMVKDGKITQENADSIKKAIEERINSCDGIGYKGAGMGMSFGRNNAGHRGAGFGATVQQ
ncbi:MAG: DUF2680 domain-containing protein [Thermoanaerobacteraceae bacterium]|nr:DUF2680 domain-containing protein [Thermoanaerobacteraceae bacterium]